MRYIGATYVFIQVPFSLQLSDRYTPRERVKNRVSKAAVRPCVADEGGEAGRWNQHAIQRGL